MLLRTQRRVVLLDNRIAFSFTTVADTKGFLQWDVWLKPRICVSAKTRTNLVSVRVDHIADRLAIGWRHHDWISGLSHLVTHRGRVRRWCCLELCVVDRLARDRRRSYRYRGQHVGQPPRASGHRPSSASIIVTYHPRPSSPSGLAPFATVLIGFRSTSTSPTYRPHPRRPFVPLAADQYFTHAQIKFPLRRKLRVVKHDDYDTVVPRCRTGNTPRTSDRRPLMPISRTSVSVTWPQVIAGATIAGNFGRNYTAVEIRKNDAAVAGLADVGTYIIKGCNIGVALEKSSWWKSYTTRR